MSRRTKLCIAALFLVLLGIPVAWFAVTWSPESPLRFRVVTQEKSKGDPFKHLRMELEVQNTSPVALHLSEMEFRAPWKPGANEDTLRPVYSRSLVLYTRDAPVRWPYTIPSLSTQRFTTEISDSDRIDMESAEILYLFRSNTKLRITELHNSAGLRLPAFLTQHIPQPSLDVGTAPPILPPE